MSSQCPEKQRDEVTEPASSPSDLPAPLKAFVDDTSAGRLLFVHMLVLRKLLEKMRERGSLSHAEAMRLLLDTVYDCAPPGSGHSEDKAARDILWATIVEQMGQNDLKVVPDS